MSCILSALIALSIPVICGVRLRSVICIGSCCANEGYHLQIHGTPREQVGRGSGKSSGKSASASVEPFPFVHDRQRIVHRDGHVEVAKSDYSVPPEYQGRSV